jgi:hypothetical protein
VELHGRALEGGREMVTTGRGWVVVGVLGGQWPVGKEMVPSGRGKLKGV